MPSGSQPFSCAERELPGIGHHFGVVHAHTFGTIDKEEEAPKLSNFFAVVEDWAGQGKKQDKDRE